MDMSGIISVDGFMWSTSVVEAMYMLRYAKWEYTNLWTEAQLECEWEYRNWLHYYHIKRVLTMQGWKYEI